MSAKNKIGIRIKKVDLLSSIPLPGLALRFARILRIREDKRLANMDSIERVRELYRRQFKVKAKLHSV
jgi:ATP-dependent DNA ligase